MADCSRPTTSSSVVTRKDSEVWLIGQPLELIGGMKLPSKRDVLRRFFFFTRTEKKTVKEASRLVLQEVIVFWEKARIPIIANYNAIPKVEKLYNEWRGLLKGRSRQSQPQIQKEKAFVDELDDLFDVAHANVLKLLIKEEDKAFLLAQRQKGRRGYMSGVDHDLAKQENRKQKQKEACERLRRKNKEEMDKINAVIELSTSNSSASETDQDAALDIAVTPLTKRRRTVKNIVSPDVSSALDRTQISDRKAVYVLSAAASSLGHDAQELRLSRSTIRRTRIDHRTRIAELIKESFVPNIPLTVHWDGKLLPDLIGNEKVDRLPILVSGEKVLKLLGVPKIPSGTGQAMAQAVVDCLDDWGIKDRVQALSFDTTASNTGINMGACTLIEKSLGRHVLYLACRHHILEIVAEKAFAQCHNQSTGPEIKLFQRFQQQWTMINKTVYETIDVEVPDRDEIILFCEQQLALRNQPRDDYRELLELSIIYLGGIPERGVRFMKPGALHRARWMARVIYGIKICLFRSQFKVTKREKTSMLRFAAFAVIIYVRSWFVAPLAAAAPANDVTLLRRLLSYQDKSISEAAIKAFSRHQWYLSEIMVSLSFFDGDTSFRVKRDMVKFLDREGSKNPPNRIDVADLHLNISAVGETTVANYITNSSRRFFKVLSLPTEFLKFDPREWNTRADYQAAQTFVQGLKVVNDSAERGVALIQNFNSILTKNEDQKQYLLQVVEEHRRKFPDTKKTTVAAQLERQ